VSADAAGTAPPLRLFFALWPTATEQTAMAQASAGGVAASGGRPIPAGNLHVTLAFLGNVDAGRLAVLRALAHDLAAGNAATLQLEFRTLEHWARPQILCATDAASVSSARGAGSLAEGIRQATLAAGFAPDLKPFHAHVTVARKVMRPVADQPITPLRWSCTYFALLASRTSANGSVYSVVESYPLVKPENARK